MQPLTLALDGCRIDRVLDGRVEIVEAEPANRRFPPRVTQTLGVCLKRGPAHRVVERGREAIYPEDAVCIRTPGCIWSSPETGPAAFLSIDVHASLLPRGLARGHMAFVNPAALPDLRALATALRSADASAGRREELVLDLVLALDRGGLVSADELGQTAPHRVSARVREAMEASIVRPPSLEALARDLRISRFALLRRFRRDFGITPHLFLTRLRIDRACERLARGGDLGEVAHQLGFADQPHFTRTFRRVVGVTPGAYARGARTMAPPAGSHFRSRRTRPRA